MTKSKLYTIVIAITLLLVAAGIAFQSLEMKDYQLFNTFMRGK